MLRIHFTDVDLARTRIASAPDPLFEIAASLHRFQSRKGRWAYAGWYRSARERMREKGLERTLRSVLLPLYPRAAYFPDFLTPVDAVNGLDAGLESILATPPERVMTEMGILDRTVGAPAWSGRLAEHRARKELVGALRAYHETVIVPHREQVQARIEAERAARCRGLLDGGVEGMLAGLGPLLRWRPPVLEVTYPRQRRSQSWDIAIACRQAGQRIARVRRWLGKLVFLRDLPEHLGLEGHPRDAHQAGRSQRRNAYDGAAAEADRFHRSRPQDQGFRIDLGLGSIRLDRGIGRCHAPLRRFWPA